MGGIGTRAAIGNAATQDNCTKRTKRSFSATGNAGHGMLSCDLAMSSGTGARRWSAEPTASHCWMVVLASTIPPPQHRCPGAGGRYSYKVNATAIIHHNSPKPAIRKIHRHRRSSRFPADCMPFLSSVPPRRIDHHWCAHRHEADRQETVYRRDLGNSRRLSLITLWYATAVRTPRTTAEQSWEGYQPAYVPRLPIHIDRQDK